jgi:hypothetical protein
MPINLIGHSRTRRHRRNQGHGNPTRRHPHRRQRGGERTQLERFNTPPEVAGEENPTLTGEKSLFSTEPTEPTELTNSTNDELEDIEDEGTEDRDELDRDELDRDELGDTSTSPSLFGTIADTTRTLTGTLADTTSSLTDTLADPVEETKPVEDQTNLAEDESDSDSESDSDEEEEHPDVHPVDENEHTSGTSPTQQTIDNLIKDYDFDPEDICLSKDVAKKDNVYTLGVHNGKYMNDFGENEPVMVALYIFPNPITTGMVVSSESSQLEPSATIQAGYNAHVRSRKMWVPFPGTPGVHIHITCGVVETVKPVKKDERVTLKNSIGIAIYSGKLGNLEKYYSNEEFHSNEETSISLGDQEIDLE